MISETYHRRRGPPLRLAAGIARPRRQKISTGHRYGRTHQLIAYRANLAATVTLGDLGANLAYNGKSVEEVGVTAAVTGLIGVIKLPSQRAPVPATQSGDVDFGEQ